jgi:spore germination protein KB
LKSQKISAFQLSVVLIMATGISNHVIVIPLLLAAAHRDAWMSAIASIIPSLVWGMLLYYLCKNIHISISEWLALKFGKAVAILLLAPYFVYFLLIVSISARDTTFWTSAAYLPNTPKWTIAASLLLLSGLAVKSGIRTLAVAAGVMLPVVVFLGLYVMTVNFQFKDYSFMLPMFENKTQDILKGTMYSASGITEIIAILFVKDQLKSQITKTNMLIIIFALIELTLGPLMGSLAMFGPVEAALQRYPAFEQWRMASFGSTLNQTDFLSIYQWISGAVVRQALGIYILVHMLQYSKKKKNMFFLIIVTTIFMATVVPLDAVYIPTLIRWFYSASYILNVAMVLILVLLVKIAK